MSDAYQILGRTVRLDTRVEDLRAALRWALEHGSAAQFDWSTYAEHLEMTLVMDEAYEMNALHDEARHLADERDRINVEVNGMVGKLVQKGL